jgi:hypothetical protein
VVRDDCVGGEDSRAGAPARSVRMPRHSVVSSGMSAEL